MPLHICHISVLNPSLHPRMFYKLALSQKKLGHQVSICAQDEKGEDYFENGIEIHSIRPFSRLSLRRLLFSFLNFRKLKRIEADVYVLHSPELIFLGWLLKARTKSKLVYDVHEDYARTFRAAAHYPGFVGKLMAFWVRKIEKWAVPKLDAVSYAEDCYENILEVAEKKKFFLRNKSVLNQAPSSSQQELPFEKYMLYTGTLAKDWGIFRSLDFWEQWNKHESLSFVMAGVSPHQSVVEEITERVAKTGLKDRFCLLGGTEYVAYADILALIENCSFGTALYEIKPHIQGKMPTKFYEFMAFDKALIYTPEPIWDAFNEKEKLGFGWKEGEEVETLKEKLKKWQTNPPQHSVESYSWESEEKILKEMLEMLEKD